MTSLENVTTVYHGQAGVALHDKTTVKPYKLRTVRKHNHNITTVLKSLEDTATTSIITDTKEKKNYQPPKNSYVKIMKPASLEQLGCINTSNYQHCYYVDNQKQYTRVESVNACRKLGV